VGYCMPHDHCEQAVVSTVTIIARVDSARFWSPQAHFNLCLRNNRTMLLAWIQVRRLIPRALAR